MGGLESDFDHSAMGRGGPPAIAVLIPCHNEELTVAQVISDFRRELPAAEIYVCDNNSTDQTAQRARAAGAHVSQERRQGKGWAVRSMLGSIAADVYILVDADGTYPANRVHDLLQPVIRGEADMVVGSRLQAQSRSEFKPLNRLANRMFLKAINLMFNAKLTDPQSGYRAFSRAFVDGVPLFAHGFELETEITVRALEHHMRVAEIPVNLGSRPPGSVSKLNLVSDGILAVGTMVSLFRDFKPLTFFGSVGLLLILAGFIPGGIVIREFVKTGVVLRLPSALLAVGLVLAGTVVISVGLVMHAGLRRAQERDYLFKVLNTKLNRWGGGPQS
jgi:glycosyltransferase involved in cell wall biosynthesis